MIQSNDIENLSLSPFSRIKQNTIIARPNIFQRHVDDREPPCLPLQQMQIPMERQLTAEEEKILHHCVPYERKLSWVKFFSPSVPVLEQGRMSSPEYFEDLVLKSTAIESLTHVGNDTIDEVSSLPINDDNTRVSSLPLYQKNGSGKVLMPQTIGPSEGLGLSLRVLSNMVGTHLEMQLQHETRMILEQKTTSSEQIERLSGTMRDYGAYLLRGIRWI